MKTNQLTIFEALLKAAADKHCEFERKVILDNKRIMIVCSPSGFMCDYHFNTGTCLKHPGESECAWCAGRFPMDQGCLNGCQRLIKNFIFTGSNYNGEISND